MLLAIVKERQVFFTLSEAPVMPSQLRIVPNIYEFGSGEPLLPDLDNGHSAYISDKYNQDLDLPILRKLGAEALTISGLIVRLKHDLHRKQPRMHSMPSESDWQTRVADILIKAMDVAQCSSDIMLLPLVPLSNGTWVVARNASIFFPTSGGIDIPTDLPLNLVDGDTLHNLSRASLFSKLGVTECSPLRIFPLIQQVYQARRIKGISWQAHTSHVKFLFWHHDKIPDKGVEIRFARKINKWFNPRDTSAGWIYCPRAQGTYAAFSILGNDATEELKSKVQVLHSKYYDLVDTLGRRNDQTVISWIHQFLEVKTSIQLRPRYNSITNSTSPELDYIAAKRPEFLLGVLQANWSQFSISDSWTSKFALCEIPILHSDTKKKLESTYLPLPRLVAVADRLGVQQDFGFIKELEGITESTTGKWYFLKQFGVVTEENIQFWLAVLRQTKINNCTNVKVISEIYLELQKFCRSPDQVQLLR